MAGLQKFNELITSPRTQNYLVQVLGERKGAFVNNLTAVVANNTQLQRCEPLTVMYAAIKATALNLPFDPALGYAYVIPYNNGRTGGVDAQFQIGWKGLVQLAQRSGQLQSINAREVKAGEIVEEDFVSGELQFKQLPQSERASAPTIGYVAFFRLKNGFQKMLYMSIEELKEHAKRFSRAANSGPWKTDFDAMARKTVLKLLLNRWCPLSVEMQQAIEFDQSVVRDESGKPEYVDNDAETYYEPTEEVIAERTEEYATQILQQGATPADEVVNQENS